jgi:hypothetical protein
MPAAAKGKTKSAKKKGSKTSMKKAKKLKNMVKSAVSGSMKYDNIDVKKLEDVDKLVEHIKGNVVTLLLIYADWCGHCGTFKESIWKKLAGMKNRKVAMAQVNEKMLEHVKNHIPNLNVDGYPNTRDMASMTKLVTADPSEVLANNGMSTANEQETAEINEAHPSSASPTSEANTARNNAGNTTVERVNSGKPILTPEQTSTVNNPPNVEDDLIATQETPNSRASGANSATPNTATVGGSLYAALLEAAGEVAVPVGLTAAAISMRSRKNKHKRRGTAKKLRGGARK